MIKNFVAYDEVFLLASSQTVNIKIIIQFLTSRNERVELLFLGIT